MGVYLDGENVGITYVQKGELPQVIDRSVTTLTEDDLDGIDTIGPYAFSYCKNLTSVTIPKNIKNIEAYAFHYCENLTDIIIPDSVEVIGTAAFSKCEKLTYNPYDNANYLGNNENPYLVLIKVINQNIIDFTINENIKIIYSSAFYYSKLTSITIPEGVTSIGENAFRSCANLTSVTIPSSVINIGTTAFSSCPKLVEINYNAINANDSSGYYPIFYDSGKSGSGITVNIGNNVKRIPSDIFSTGSSSYTPNITVLNIGNSVEEIGHNAFAALGIASVTIPSSVKIIGNSSFAYCRNLVNAIIENGIETIGDWAFQYCSGLTSITIPDSVTSIGFSAFNSCTKLTSVTIGSGITSIGHSVFSQCPSLTSITIPDSVTSIEQSAFSSSGLISIEIPSTITKIGPEAFYKCSSLTSVIYEGQAPGITVRTFYNCTSIIKYDFRNCTKVTSLYNTGSLGHADGCQIIIPDALYDEWTTATNWVALTDVTFVKASEYVEV